MEKGKVFIVKQGLYGLKFASASFRAYLACKLEEMDFKSSIADPDVWMKPQVKPNGDEYYEYILAYIVDILAISHHPHTIMDEIQTRFTIKNNKVKEPSSYLGAKLENKDLNGRYMWTITSINYINAAITYVDQLIEGVRWKMPKETKATTPVQSNFVPELDGSLELNDKDHNYYQELIGILQWAVEIGRVNILHEVLLLSQYQASSWEGHMEQALHIFSYLKLRPKLTLYFDPNLPNIDCSGFKSIQDDFKEQYRGAEEAMPHNMLVPCGKTVTTSTFVDTSFAEIKVTRKSHKGFVVFVHWATNPLV